MVCRILVFMWSFKAPRTRREHASLIADALSSGETQVLRRFHGKIQHGGQCHALLLLRNLN